MKSPDMRAAYGSGSVAPALITGIALAGLYYAGASHPAMAIPAGGVSGAIAASCARKNGVWTAAIPATLTGMAVLYGTRFDWAAVAFAACVATALLWVMLSRGFSGMDDRLILPGIGLAGCLAILWHVRSLVIPNGLHFREFIGLTGTLEGALQLLSENALDLKGEAREQYFQIIEKMRRDFPWVYTGGQAALYSLILNMVYRYQTRGLEPKEPFVLFRIRERYVALLIIGMGLEVFRYMTKQEELVAFSRPLLFYFGCMCFLAGLAVLIFLILTRRAVSDSFFSRWFMIVIFFLLIMKPIISAAIGLLDIWFDLRKLKHTQGGGKT